MKVLLLNTYSTGGGAAVATQRVKQALERHGAEVRLLTAPLRLHTIKKLGERLPLLRYVGWDRERLFDFSPLTPWSQGISRHPDVAWADVIHLHWVQHAFLSLVDIEALISTGKPIFWTLHDLWPVTGGCHLPLVCTSYQQQCGNCPRLGSQRPHDLSASQWQAKRQLSYEQLHFIAVSRDVQRLAQQASLSQHSTITHIPNLLNNLTFSPSFHTPEGDKITLLFVAARIDDPIKGLPLCIEALQHACQLSPEWAQRAVLRCIGRVKNPNSLKGCPIPIEQVGPIQSERQMADEYARATLTLSTSHYETFGQSIAESIACGTPAVAFAVGGLSDIIINGVNGRLVKPYLLNDMAEALIEQSSHPPRSLTERRVVAHTLTWTHESPVASSLLQAYQSALTASSFNNTERASRGVSVK